MALFSDNIDKEALFASLCILCLLKWFLLLNPPNHPFENTSVFLAIFKSFVKSFAFSHKILSNIIKFFDNACFTQIKSASSNKGYFASWFL